MSVAWFGEPLATTDYATALGHIVTCAAQLGEHIRAHPRQWHVPADLAQMAWGTDGGRAVDGSEFAELDAGDVPRVAHVRM
jgi:hypothetical protein